MLISLFLVLFLSCVGMSVMFVVYACLLWFTTCGRSGNEVAALEIGSTVKPATAKGLSVEELEKLHKVSGKELVMGNNCVVCLDEIKDVQPVRMVRGCNHGFHL